MAHGLHRADRLSASTGRRKLTTNGLIELIAELGAMTRQKLVEKRLYCNDRHKT